jgi:8-oxo-dGTP pyrophosphatase MutT (NUDIX family)
MADSSPDSHKVKINLLPVAEFMATLPRKRMAATAVIRNQAGEVLLVKPSYRPEWLMPGGMVEADESPYAACKREALEEIGLELPIGRLLSLAYQSRDGDYTEALMFAFDGGVLLPQHIAQIKLQEGEITAFQFLPLEAALPILPIKMRGRIAAALAALADGSTAYLDDGQLIR